MAQTYTAADLTAYADTLDDLAEALPIEAKMEKSEVKQLVALSQALGGAASNMRLIAVQDLLADTTKPLSDVSAATKEAQATLKKIKDVSRVISLVGDVVVLGQVIATQNWKMILPAFKNLRSELDAT